MPADTSRIPLRSLLLTTTLAVLSAIGSAYAGEVRFDFEDGMQGWRVVSGSFGVLRTNRRVYHHTGEPYNNEGAFFLSTLETDSGHPDDTHTGRAESPLFRLESASMTLLVGGGNHPDTYVALCTEDGTEVRWARGEDAQPMVRLTWEAPELVGKVVFLRLCDENRGSWGHVTLDDFKAAGQIDAEATDRRLAAIAEQQAHEHVARFRAEVNLEGLRALVQTFPHETSTVLLARVDALEEELTALHAAPPEDMSRTFARIRGEQRAIMLANPILTDHPVIFVVREQYRPDHHNTATLFQVGEVNTQSFTPGGALKLLSLPSGTVTTLLETDTGVIRDPEVSFDGDRILFSMRRDITENYHIYEMNAYGTGLRALTSAPEVSDIDPMYLPDGGIVFASTREPKYCMCNQHIMANLFRMEADGANIRQIGRSTLFEGHPSLLPDGRVLYDRWEYVDRNFGDAQGLWTVNPDGTNHAVYYGNNTWSPGGVIDARPVPGTGLVLCVFGACHDRPWGAMALIDRERGVDGRAAVLRTWPASAIELVEAGADQAGYGFDSTVSLFPKYEDPYPLDATTFLCSRMTGEGEQMGIYVTDVFGNETLLHTEGPGCFDPMPLAPRQRPMTIPDKRHYDARPGQFYVADVYAGTHMRGIERGVVKSLRVVASPEKRFFTDPAWGGQGVHRPAMNWHDFSNKRILGTVPVEEDGSAYFEAPPDTFLYFQLLDERGMMVQSMRSGVMVQPGELLGCVGCHEDRLSAPHALDNEMPLAVRRAASSLNGWNGPPRDFSFMAEVQPVLDRHCVSCHDYGQPAGEALNLAPDLAETFNTAYTELWRKGQVKAIGAGPAAIQQPYTWGSHPTPLVQMLFEGHGDTRLSEEEINRIITWIDINAPYYPSYASAYPDNLAGRCPLTNEELGRLGELCSLDFFSLADFSRNTGPQISFDRPETSPCLRNAGDPGSGAYAEALSIIKRGQARLAENPRGDTPDFTPGKADQLRQERYVTRQSIELENRAAIRDGRRVHDPGIIASTTGEHK